MKTTPLLFMVMDGVRVLLLEVRASQPIEHFLR